MENKVDPTPWNFNLTQDEIHQIWEFALQSFIEKAVPYKTKPDHYHLMCMLDGYHKFLEKKANAK